MKIMFIAPRFHTNQKEIIKELINRENEVHFYSIYIGATEDYSTIKPEMLPSKENKSISRDNLENEMQFVSNFKLDIKKFKKILYKINPDLIVLRGKSKTMRKIYCISWIHKYKTILYDQAPLYEKKVSFWKKIKRFIYNINVPKIRYTPVKYLNYDQKENKDVIYKNKKSYYVPFVVKTTELLEKEYMCNGELHIIDVGKYREYKNHYVLLEALLLCKNRKKIKVSIIGQAVSNEEKKYYEKVKDFCKKNKLEESVELYKNVSPNKMDEYYNKNDVIVLCSYNENASISILEAMSRGLSPISTRNNGTAFLIDENNGRVFEPKNPQELANIMDSYFENEMLVKKLGVNSKKFIENNNSPIKYIDAVNYLLKKEGIGGQV